MIVIKFISQWEWIQPAKRINGSLNRVKIHLHEEIFPGLLFWDYLGVKNFFLKGSLEKYLIVIFCGEFNGIIFNQIVAGMVDEEQLSRYPSYIAFTSLTAACFDSMQNNL